MNKNIGALILLGLMLLIGYVIPVTLVLGNSEITNAEYSFQLTLFSQILFAGVIGIGVLYFGRYLMKKDDKYLNSFGFFDIGEAVPYFKRFTAVQLGLLSSILVSTLFLISSYLKFGGFTSGRVLPMQFSPIQGLVFSSLLIPTSEEAMALFVVGMMVLALVLVAIKYKIPKNDFMIYYFVVIPVLLGIVATIWHVSAYSNSSINLLIVFFFWCIKTFLGLATGFFLIPWLMHTANNFFIDFARIFTSDAILYVAITLIIIQVIIYVLVYRNRLFGSNKKEEIILG